MQYPRYEARFQALLSVDRLCTSLKYAKALTHPVKLSAEPELEGASVRLSPTDSLKGACGLQDKSARQVFEARSPVEDQRGSE